MGDIVDFLQKLAAAQQTAQQDMHGKVPPSEFLNPMPGTAGMAAPRSSMVPAGGSPRQAARQWETNNWHTPSSGNVVNMASGTRRVLEREDAGRRSEALQQFGQEGGGVIHTLPNRYSIGIRPGSSPDVSHTLLSPQGSPVLYGRSPQDVVKRGFPDEEHAALLQSLPGTPGMAAPRDRTGYDLAALSQSLDRRAGPPPTPQMPDSLTANLQRLKSEYEANYRGVPPPDNVVPFK